ncbi:Beta-lactamase/transpeptidase-like protein [Pseudocohnilembus persalinus]|uniref:Beta-lactamase/transpeptidase-like protein n=1 Tax=Pseudocohnilembus persalinus TaxID=266149 RepID=A0A0V0QSM7_PSEPJ|nr:Beta-lactamase/transpeptidase-like protein [Pseudocohnilembus persalinus]|eukprot:KRX05002.1 Beta-lactamase/transpeptidase-like protein [Pseudocohnilembus persalinus]
MPYFQNQFQKTLNNHFLTKQQQIQLIPQHPTAQDKNYKCQNNFDNIDNNKKEREKFQSQSNNFVSLQGKQIDSQWLKEINEKTGLNINKETSDRYKNQKSNKINCKSQRIYQQNDLQTCQIPQYFSPQKKQGKNFSQNYDQNQFRQSNLIQNISIMGNSKGLYVNKQNSEKQSNLPQLQQSIQVNCENDKDQKKQVLPNQIQNSWHDSKNVVPIISQKELEYNHQNENEQNPFLYKNVQHNIQMKMNHIKKNKNNGKTYYKRDFDGKKDSLTQINNLLSNSLNQENNQTPFLFQKSSQNGNQQWNFKNGAVNFQKYQSEYEQKYQDEQKYEEYLKQKYYKIIKEQQILKDQKVHETNKISINEKNKLQNNSQNDNQNNQIDNQVQIKIFSKQMYINQDFDQMSKSQNICSIRQMVKNRNSKNISQYQNSNQMNQTYQQNTQLQKLEEQYQQSQKLDCFQNEQQYQQEQKQDNYVQKKQQYKFQVFENIQSLLDQDLIETDCTSIKKEIENNQPIDEEIKFELPNISEEQQKFIINSKVILKQYDFAEYLGIEAKSFCALDFETGRFLVQFKGKKEREIASLTKIMTFYTVLQIAKEHKINLKQENIQISKTASSMIGTSANIKAGEQYKAYDLCFGLMLPSGNDAAFALAANPHGLVNKFNKSCAIDQARLSYICIRDEEFFQEVVKTRQYECEFLSKKGNKKTKIWENTNKLLNYQCCLGIKTGITVAAGPCLSSIFEKNYNNCFKNILHGRTVQ